MPKEPEKVPSTRSEIFDFDDDKRKKIKEEIDKEYTTFVGFLGLLIRTVNPLSYKKICTASFGQGLRFYLHLLLFSFLLFFLFTVPYLFNFYEEMRAETNNLNSFSLAPQLDVNQTIEFEDFDLVVANEKAYEGEFLLITQQSIFWKNNLCLFSKLACFANNDPHQVEFSRAQQLVEDRDTFTNVIFFFILLMLPGIFLSLFFYHLVKFFLVIVLYFFIGYIYTMLIRYEIHTRQLFLVAVYSMSITIVVETVFGIYYDTYYIPYALSFVLFIVSNYLVAEKPFHHFKHH